MSKIKIVFSVILVFIVIFLAVNLVKKRQNQLSSEKTPEKPVYIVNGVYVEKGSLKVYRNFIGKVFPELEVNISTNQSGYITKVFVKENQYVKKGDLLVEIDSTPLNLEIQNLKLSLDILNNQLQTLKAQEQSLKLSVETLNKVHLRNKQLFENKALAEEKLELSKLDLEKAKSSYIAVIENIKTTKSKIKQIQNQIKVKKNSLKYLIIKAPFEAVVSKIYTKEGNLVALGKPILKLHSEDRLKVLVSIPPDIKVRKDQKVIIKTDKKVIHSKISKILKETDKNSLVVAKILIKEPIEIGRVVNVLIPVNYKEGFKLPADAVLHTAKGTFVLKSSKNNTFKKIPVKVLASDGNFVVIKGNLQEKDIVAVAKESKLRLLSAGAKGKIIIRGEK